MTRTLTTSITLAAALVFVGFYAFAQERPVTAAPQPAFTKVAPAPGGVYGLPSAEPAPVPFPPGARTFVINDYQNRFIDEPTQNRDRELSRDTSGLVEKYGHAKEAKDKADIEKELTRVVTDHFALRQEIREKELQDLEEQLNRLRATHKQRAAEKDRIVSDRVQQLLRDASGLGWGADVNSSKNNFLYYNAPRLDVR